MLGDPAGDAFADFDAQIAQGGLFTFAGGDGVIKLLRRFVHHEQRPQSASMRRSMCSRMVRRIVSRSKLELSDRAS